MPIGWPAGSPREQLHLCCGLIVAHAKLRQKGAGAPMSIRSHARAAMTLAAVAATLALTAPTRAQTYDPAYPVCLQVYQSISDYYFECAYQTMAQCQASASGRSASCVVNPYYKGRAAPGPGRKKPRHY
jgi:hypothetical protein